MANLEDLTVNELHELAEKQGVDVPKSAKKTELIDALTAAEAEPEAELEAEPQPAVEPEPEAEAALAAEAELPAVEELTVKRVDREAILTVNGQQFRLSPTDVRVARKALEVAHYELY